MTTQRAFAKRNEEGNVNQGAPPQALVYLLAENVTNVVFMVAFEVCAQAVMAQDNREEERPIGASPVEWDVFKSVFLDRFFTLELREAKMEEFINLHQESISVKESALKFTQLSKYTPTIVVDSRAKMNKFVMGVSDMEKNREVKRVKTGDGNFSNARSNGQGPPRFRQRFSNQGSSNSPPRVNNDMVSNPKSQGGYGSGSDVARSTCVKCGKKHHGKCLAGTNGCFGCGKSEKKMRDCPVLMAKGREGKQAPPNGSRANASMQNCFYALQNQNEQRDSPYVVTIMLKFFHIDVYDFLDPGATLSFVMPYVAMRFDMLPDLLLEPFSVSTSVGDSEKMPRFPIL
ncbi:uncharacterized protein LOC125842906 [Solanum stenotomum]|uniref:uncharacterized protein LOC125842906 n=1 Tax=Solanum stenotomum TaxID=172797 RepID=UPI0020D04ED5|nr:uncharacterized protein LOC125842906 [Solanum stenotomum]